MQRGMLAEYFTGVVRKKLSMVEVNPKGSNQHEINATVEVKNLLGVERQTFNALFIYFEGEQAAINDNGFITSYDARENNPKRTEHRVYFSTNAVTVAMEEGDTLFLAIRADRTAMFIVAQDGSAMTEQLSWLFGLEHQPNFKFDGINYGADKRGEIDFLSRQILEILGIEYEDPKANEHDSIIEKFGMKFPKTKEFSALARLTLPQIDARDDPDFALMAWLDHEEALFRRLEKRIVGARLVDGFMAEGEPDVDDFIQFSLSVQNRRKSRMGHSLENHLAAVFDSTNTKYASQFKTMKGKKPDFIFPNAESYMDQEYPVESLTMLAAKSSCKERWSQVLSEADRIPTKHLLTLDPGIPEQTTATMQADNLSLVVPLSRQSGYSEKQKKWLLSLTDFIKFVHERQPNA